MPQRSISLQALLASVFGFLALALTFCVSLAAERIAAPQLREQIGHELSGYVEHLRGRLDAVMHDNLLLVRTLATMGQSVSATPATWRKWIDTVQADHKEYAWLGIADTNGVVMASSGGLLEGKSVRERPWFREALLKPYAGDVHEALLLAQKLPPLPDGEPLRFVDVSTPVHDGQGRLVGVLGGHMSWTWARRIERSILAPFEERQSGIESLILRDDGEVLLGPSDIMGKRLAPDVIKAIADASTSRKGSSAVVSFGDDQSFLVSASRSVGAADYAGMDWTVVIRQPTRTALAPVTDLRRAILFWGLALALLFGVLGLLVARMTTRPLLALVAFAQRHRLGDRSTAVPSGGYREANVLSASLERLISDLTARDAALEANNRALENRVETRTLALREASAFTQKIMENSPDVILVAGPDGQVEFASRSAHWLHNMPEADALVGRRLFSLFPRTSVEDLQAAMLQACETPVVETEIFCPSKTGSGQWLSVLVSFMHDGHNHVERVLCIIRDRTIEHAQAETERAATAEAQRLTTEANAASEAKSAFLASMSHEIRTPLNAVIGFTGIILARTDLPPDLARQVLTIQTSGNALLTVVNDVLDFSKIESGAIELEPRPFSIRGLADNALAIVASLADDKGLVLTLEIDPRLSPCHVGDEDRLRQVLLNLVNNAVKFTRDGSVTLRVAFLDRTETCERVVVSVTDTGIGIPPEKIDRLFKRFSQVDGSIRREFGGTGLGLAISQRLVGLMGGEITVSSEAWKGSTFSFSLSLDLADAASLAAPEPVLLAPARPRRLLLAEDLPANQEIVRIILEASGHSVDVVEDGASAVQAVAGGDYDAVLMDVQMPVMDGLTATAEIRKLPGEAARIPIIALTANVLSDQVKALRAAGMDDHVGKPFRRADLLQAIERCCRSDIDDAPVEAPGPPAASGDAPDALVLDELIGLAGLAQVLAWLDDVRGRIAYIYPAAGTIEVADHFMADNHTLISQAGMLGFTALSEACQAVEAAHRSGGDIGEAIDRCRVEAQRAIAACGRIAHTHAVAEAAVPVRIAG
ncbi:MULTISPECIES: ATP-binding protein [unclassified Methylobacterium]|uniref:ATP-binding protein n=1 Tax=unclassified Methylobacterium TaxID=2615210 RepID=UPI000A66DFC3|nr:MULTISPECIES: ATP-binding protein [unclassified Methylobacterium]